jgi:transcriptional regulator with XRE-family HTH domain
MSKATKGMKEEKLNPKVLLRIKEALKAKGLRPVNLARKLNYSDSWASYLMRGRRSLTVNQLMKIAEILHVEPSSLLPHANPEPKPEFEEYVRSIVRDVVQEELEKALKKK